jgi:hypothetical protein
MDVIGDEYHYLFICNNTEIQRLRSKYIPKYYVQNSSVAKMAGIFSLCNSQLHKINIKKQSRSFIYTNYHTLCE